MARTTSLLLVLILAASLANAGTVTLEPAVVTVDPGQPAEYTVTVTAAEQAEFTTLDLLFSSDRADLVLSFTYNDDFADGLTLPDPVSLGTFASDLYVGGVNPDSWQTGAIVGVLRIDTTGLASGTYDDVIGARPDAEETALGGAVSQISAGTTETTEQLAGTAGLVITGTVLDTDGDGVEDINDAFPEDASETTDTDGDSIGDNSDAFPEDASEDTDTDDDGIGDNADDNDDNDEALDVDDDFPLDPAETTDTDGDGVGDNADAFPEDSTETVDSDRDGIGDNADVDDTVSVVTPPCAAGMLGCFLATLAGLSTLRLRRRKA